MLNFHPMYERKCRQFCTCKWYENVLDNVCHFFRWGRCRQRINSSASENIFTSASIQNKNEGYLSTNAYSLPKRNLDNSNKTQCLHTSALYGNPSTLLGNLNEMNQSGRFPGTTLNKNVTSYMKNETDDSGLSVDSQEQTYLKSIRNFKPIQRQINEKREDDLNEPLRYNFRQHKKDEFDFLHDSSRENVQYIEFDEDFYCNVNFVNNNSITKPFKLDTVSSIRSDGIINQKRMRGPLYIQSRGSSRFPQNKTGPDGDIDIGMGKRRSASLEFILSPIIKSTYQPGAVE